MARHVYEFKVNDIKYEANTFNGKKGIRNITRLMNLIGPSLESALSGMGEDGKTIESEAISAAVGALFNNIDDTTVVSLMDDLLESVFAWVNDKKVRADLDEYFSGDYGNLMIVLSKILKENYSSFFVGGVSDLLDLVPKNLGRKSGKK